MSETFYVFRPKGTPLGTIDAPDANDAQRLATTMWGASAYVFPATHTSWSERLLARWKQATADGAS